MQNQYMFNCSIHFLESQLGLVFTETNFNDQYSNVTFQNNQLKLINKIANITPKKIGQFTAIWQRDQNGQCAPFSINDDFELMIIHCFSGKNYGQFVFDKPILTRKKIIQSPNIRGKNGMRVYPAWDLPQNPTAIKTQQWQLPYFIDFNNFQLKNAKRLYQII